MQAGTNVVRTSVSLYGVVRTREKQVRTNTSRYGRNVYECGVHVSMNTHYNTGLLVHGVWMMYSWCKTIIIVLLDRPHKQNKKLHNTRYRFSEMQTNRKNITDYVDRAVAGRFKHVTRRHLHSPEECKMISLIKNVIEAFVSAVNRLLFLYCSM